MYETLWMFEGNLGVLMPMCRCVCAHVRILVCVCGLSGILNLIVGGLTKAVCDKPLIRPTVKEKDMQFYCPDLFVRT